MKEHCRYTVIMCSYLYQMTLWRRTWHPWPLWRLAQSTSLAYQGESPTLSLQEQGNYSTVTSLRHRGSLYSHRGAVSLPLAPCSSQSTVMPQLSSAPVSLMSASPLRSWLRRMCKGPTLDESDILNVLPNKCPVAEPIFWREDDICSCYRAAGKVKQSGNRKREKISLYYYGLSMTSIKVASPTKSQGQTHLHKRPPTPILTCSCI